MAEGPVRLTTPVAILLAGLAIGVGLYAGPRGAVPPDAHGPAQEPVRRVTRQEAEAQASAALTALWDARRAAVRQACWTPIAPQVPADTQVSYALEVIYAVDGKALLKSLQGARVVRGDVPVTHPAFRGLGTCVQQQLGAVNVAAPGMQVRVVIPVTLP